MAPMEVIWLFLVKCSLCLPLCGSPPTPTVPPYKCASGIGYTHKNYLKWREIQLAIQCIADTVNYLEYL